MSLVHRPVCHLFSVSAHAVAAWLLLFADASSAAPAQFDEALSALDRGDYGAALQLLQMQAADGNAAAMAQIALMYGRGLGVQADQKVAFGWWLKCAEAGDAFCQDYVGHVYAEGGPVQSDFIEAYKWLDLASSRYPEGMKHFVAPMRDSLAGKMMPSEVAEAQRRVRSWRPPRQQ